MPKINEGAVSSMIDQTPRDATPHPTGVSLHHPHKAHRRHAREKSETQTKCRVTPPGVYPTHTPGGPVAPDVRYYRSKLLSRIP